MSAAEHKATPWRPIVNNLSQDLIALIVRNASDDVITLKSCALVGPAWVAPCRALLFRNVTLSPRHFGEGKDHTLAVFDAIPSLGSYIISLTITSGKPWTRDSFPPRLALEPEFLCMLLRHMPRLHTVTLLRCAVEPRADMATTLLPHCWQHPGLRLLRIIASDQGSPIVDMFRTLVFFRCVPVDVLKLARDYDAKDYDTSKHALFVGARQYELLRGWSVGICHLGARLWRPQRQSELEIGTVISGILIAAVTDTLFLDNWGVNFLKLFPDLDGRENVKHVKLEVLARPPPKWGFQEEHWAFYARLAGMQSITFVFNLQSLLERFGSILLDRAIPCLPLNTRVLGFEVQLEDTAHVSPEVLLRWWEGKMPWDGLEKVLTRLKALQRLCFCITILPGLEQGAARKLEEEVEAIVRRRVPEIVVKGKVQFLKS